MTVAKNPRLQYLKKRGNRYWLKVPIPTKLRPLFINQRGNPSTHIEESLGTSNLDEAYTLKLRRLVAIDALFRQKRRSESVSAAPNADEMQLARAFRENLAEATREGNDDAAEVVALLVSDRAESILDQGGGSAAAETRAKSFAAVALGARTLREEFDGWIGKSGLPLRTCAKYRTALDEFCNFLGGAALVEDMTRSNAVAYVDWLNRDGRSQRTKKAVPLAYNTKRDRVMALSAFWSRGLSARGKTGSQANPWSNLQITEKPTSPVEAWDSMGNAGRPKKRPYFTDDDVLAILRADGPRDSKVTRYPKKTLMEVLCLGLLTGARPDELCSLRLGDVSKTRGVWILNITDAKNSDSDRRIPVVHPVAAEILSRRVGKRTEASALLFAEFRPKAGDGSMAELVMRALRRHLQRVPGLQGDLVPYCTRHTLQTLMGNRDDVKDAVMQRYVGHRPAAMTDRHYRSITLESLTAFAKKVQYGKAVEREMRKQMGMSTTPRQR